MTSFIYAAGSSQSFDPASDSLTFPNEVSASQITLKQVGSVVRVGYSGSFISSLGVSVWQLTTANLTLDNGSSVFAFGTSGDRRVGNGNDQTDISARPTA